MHIPTSLIMALFLIAFVLTAYQYYRINPLQRVQNARFALMAITALGACSFPVVAGLAESRQWETKFSVIYLAVAVICLGASYFLLRRMPPPSTH